MNTPIETSFGYVRHLTQLESFANIKITDLSKWDFI